MANEQTETIEQRVIRIQAEREHWQAKQDAAKAAERAAVVAEAKKWRDKFDAEKVATEAAAAKKTAELAALQKAAADAKAAAELSRVRVGLRAAFAGSDTEFERDFPALLLAWRTSETIRLEAQHRADSARMVRNAM